MLDCTNCKNLVFSFGKTFPFVAHLCWVRVDSRLQGTFEPSFFEGASDKPYVEFLQRDVTKQIRVALFQSD